MPRPFLDKYKVSVLAVLLLTLCFNLFSCAKGASGAGGSSSQISSQAVSSSSQASSSLQTPSQTPSSQTVTAQGQKAGSSAAVPSQTPKKTAAPVQAPAAQYTKHVTLTIDATKGNDGVVANAKQVGIHAGESVYTVLKRYCDENKILLAAQKTGKGVYVSAIDGVAQFDCGAQSGWMYSVNGAYPQNDCNTYKLNGGETLKWIYTTDLGKAEGQSK